MNRPIKEDKKTAFLSFLCQKTEMESLLTLAKESIDDLFASLKVALVEFLLSAEREQIAGHLYSPYCNKERKKGKNRIKKSESYRISTTNWTYSNCGESP